jgi:FdhD protein
MPQPVTRVSRLAWHQHGVTNGERLIPEETAVAFTYNGGTYAVMMATPQDLKDFAFGFSLTEGIIASPEEVRQLDIVEEDLGIELRMWLSEPRALALNERRRHLAGPTGCGLCGIESLGEALRPPPKVGGDFGILSLEIRKAIDALAPHQRLNNQTRAVHAAGFWQPCSGLVALREDVGRHNALDKLAGTLAQNRIAARAGIVLLTSRVSVEMVQKAAMIEAPILLAISAPTALAVRIAEDAGITLIAIARNDGFEVFTHAHRVSEHADAPLKLPRTHSKKPEAEAETQVETHVA